MNILFCGGGTAGHVTPNLALIEEIHRYSHKADYETTADKRFDCNATTACGAAHEQADNVDKTANDGKQKVDLRDTFANCTVYYVGNTEQDEKLLLPYVKSGKVARHYALSAPKLRRSLALSNLCLPFKFVRAVRSATKIIDEVCPDVVFSKGGYVGLPVVIAARKRGIPTLLHESDMSMGLANKLSLRYVTRALSAFVLPETSTTVTGMILRSDITRGDRQKGLRFCDFDGTKPLLLVVGGSLGAQALNEAVAATPKLAEKFDIFVLTGKGKHIDCPFVHQAEFCTSVKDLFAAADVCLTRGGSTTLCELTLCKVPFVAVPLTNGSRGEQSTNVKSFVQKGCGLCLNEVDLPDKLYNAVCTCYDNRAAFAAKQARQFSSLYGTEKCLQQIAEVATEHLRAND